MTRRRSPRRWPMPGVSRPALHRSVTSHEPSGAVWRVAPSKLNHPVSVPVFALTLSAARTAEPPYTCGAHTRVVAVVQAVEPHTSAVASEAVTVRSTVAKFCPLIVSDPPPLPAALADARCVKTGAAYKH